MSEEYLKTNTTDRAEIPSQEPTIRLLDNIRIPKRPADRDGLATISYSRKDETVNELFDKIVKAVRPYWRFYCRGRQLVFIEPEVGLSLVTFNNGNAHLSSLVEICFIQRDQVRLRYDLLPHNHLQTFILSHRVISQFPRVTVYSRTPVFNDDWTLVSVPGYYKSSGIYYDGPEVHPRAGSALVNHVLADFCWKSESDRVNYLGLLITAVTMPHWIGKHPLAVFNGNKPGVGKSLLARVLGLVVDGSQRTISYSANDEEFEKQLATRVDSGERVVIVDNAKRSRNVPEVESQVLERCVTDSVLNFRRLGSNTSISRPNDVIFCLTMNFTRLSRDLRRRSIPINLEQTSDVRDISFSTPNLEAFVIDHRNELIAELAGMVDSWLDGGRWLPEKPARHSVSQTWATTIDAILQVNGYRGFMENFDDSERAFDSDYEALHEICEEFHSEPPSPPAAWAGKLRSAGLLEDRLKQGGFYKSERAQATTVGTLFNAYLGRHFEIDAGTYKLMSNQRKRGHKSNQYWFERVSEGGSQRDSENSGHDNAAEASATRGTSGTSRGTNQTEVPTGNTSTNFNLRVRRNLRNLLAGVIALCRLLVVRPSNRFPRFLP